MKWELHAHSAESSHCGKVPVAELIAAHVEAGYDGIVLTDHYSYRVDQLFEGTPLEKAQQWLESYYLARKYGEEQGLTVLFGLEARFPDVKDNDYLVFGVEPNFVLENPELHKLSCLKDLSDLVHRYNGLIIQAHPNRERFCCPADFSLLDGIEIYNGCVRHYSNNALSVQMAKENPQLITTSGSDYHRLEDIGRGGILTNEVIRTSAELADCLRRRAFEVIPTPYPYEGTEPVKK